MSLVEIKPWRIRAHIAVVLGGLFEEVIPRFQVLPSRKSLVVKAPENQYQSTNIRIYEGARRLVRDNHKLAEFELPNLIPGSNITITITEDTDFTLIVNVEDISE